MNHHLLIKNLNTYVFRGIASDLMKNYIIERIKDIKIDQEKLSDLLFETDKLDTR